VTICDSCVLPYCAAGIRNLHVLPYISQFCLMAHDLELLLAQVTCGEDEESQDHAAQEATGTVRAGGKATLLAW
jgi:hypothetical protein